MEPIGWFERYLNLWIAIGVVTLAVVVWQLIQ